MVGRGRAKGQEEGRETEALIFFGGAPVSHTKRVFFDGTHGISVDRRVRIRDKYALQPPGTSHVRCRNGQRLEMATFALTADVSEAHRQVSIHPQGRQSIRRSIQKGSQVWVVGTFVVSVSCCWSRVAGAIGRISQYLISNRIRIWHLLVAGDFSIEAGVSSAGTHCSHY